MDKKQLILSCCITAIFSSCSKENGHEYVDLGLTSGTKWATMNIGANTPEEEGSSFAWGEINSGHDRTWEKYKLACNSGRELIRYNTLNQYGKVDYKTTLDARDDAAAANWGGDWHIPTEDQWEELLEECGINEVIDKNERVTLGYKIVSNKNGNYIFLPNETYWSSTLCEDNPTSAYSYELSSWERTQDISSRIAHCNIRAVCE